MPNILSFNKKTKKRCKKYSKRISFLFGFVFLVLFLLLLLNFSDIISSLLTHKNSLFYTNKIEVPSYSIYAVTVNDFETKKEAEVFCSQIKQMGGAGLVYEYGENFVIASSYPTLAEAKEIEENLILLGYNPKILNIKVESVSLKYKGKDIELFENSIKFLRQCYNSIYETCLKYDKGELNRQEVNSKLAQSITKCSLLQNDLRKIKRNNDKLIAKKVTECLEEVGKNLNYLLCLEDDNLKFSSNLKSVNFNIVLCNIALQKKLTSSAF